MNIGNKEGHTRLWVANLQEDLSNEQVIHLFEKYGPVHNIVRKGNFASIEFENPNEALRAKRGLDQVDYYGRRLNIDWYRGDKFCKLEGKNWWNGKSEAPRFKHRVCVLGLPKTTAYPDVLDLAQQAGFSVVFIDIVTSRCGFVYAILEYAYYEDYRFALDYLDGMVYKMSDGTTTTLRFIKGNELLDVERYVAEHNPTLFHPEQKQQDYDVAQQQQPHRQPPAMQPPHPSASSTNVPPYAAHGYGGPPPPNHNYPPPTMPPPNYYSTAPPPANYRPPPPNYRPPAPPNQSAQYPPPQNTKM